MQEHVAAPAWLRRLACWTAWQQRWPKYSMLCCQVGGAAPLGACAGMVAVAAARQAPAASVPATNLNSTLPTSTAPHPAPPRPALPLPCPAAALDSRARLAYRSRAQAALHQLNNLAHVLHAVEASRELKGVGEGWAAQHKVGGQGGRVGCGVCVAWDEQALWRVCSWRRLVRRQQQPRNNQHSCVCSTRTPIAPPGPPACLQRRVEEYQQQYVEAAWGSLLALLRQDARQPLPPNLAVDKAARQAVKDKWTAVNKVLAEAQAQQVGRAA